MVLPSTSTPRSSTCSGGGAYCWVVTGSLWYDRALVEPEETPDAVAYYERLAEESEVAYQVSPYLAWAWACAL